MKKSILVLVVGMIVGFIAAKFMLTDKSFTASDEKTAKIKYWVAPMDPNYRRDKAGKSPMGMELVPVYTNEGNASLDKSLIKISPQVINNLGVVTAPAQVTTLSRQINTVGYVTANERNIEIVHTYVDGWVRDLNVSAVGDQVKRGQVLFDLYSPTLVNAQQEFVLALNNNNRQLIAASQKKLLTLGLKQSQINSLKKNKIIKKQVSFYAGSDGIISKLAIRDGQYIKPDINLMVVEDLKSVWLKVAIVESQSSWVKLNQIAIATFPAIKGKKWQGDVIYVYPTLDKATHTLAVRLQFPNPNLSLKPNMYANVKILVPGKKALTIPKQAVIQSASGAHVIMALGEGRFKPQTVILGDESMDKVAVISGLKAGDQVVTSGQFLIDSESNLTAGMQRLSSVKESITSVLTPDASFEAQTHPATILAIDVKKHRLVISHMPIKSLGMPEMVMKLPVKSDIDLSGFTVGQRVIMGLEKVKSAHYIINSLSPQIKE